MSASEQLTVRSPAFWSTGLVVRAAICVAALVLAFSNPYFSTAANLQNLVRNSGFFLIFALAQMLPIVVRGLDLSQGGLVAFTSVAAAMLSPVTGTPGAFAICLAFSLIFGFVQGGLVGLLGLSAFVVTLGGGSALTGAALLLSNGQTIYEVPDDFRVLGWTDPLGLPLVALTATALLAAAWIILSGTSAGRRVYATGSNPKAAIVIGVPTRITTLACYCASALLTTLGGLFLSSRITSGSPVIGGDIALQSIAATVVGGVSLLGGRGHPAGVALGAIALATIANLLNLYNISSYWQPVLFGAVIVVAVSFDRLRLSR